MNKFFLLCLPLLLLSCKTEVAKDKTQSVQAEKESSTTIVQSDYVAPPSGATDSESFNRHFAEQEKDLLLKIKQDFELGMCEEQRIAKNMKECYEGHAQMIRSDFFQKIPVTMSYPYKTDYQLDKAKTKAVLSSVWTDKCGYQTDEGVVNYFCLDAAAKVMDYYKEVAQKSDYIGAFTESYIKNKTLTEAQITNLLMTSGESLDFENFDHQLFYAILHLTWNEENKALKKIK